MRKHIYYALFTLVCLLWGNNAYPNTANDIIATDINTDEWFKLEKHLRELPVDSISPFVGLVGRALVATKFNRPEESVVVFRELLDNYSKDLGLNNILMMSHLMANDLSKLNRNEEAAKLIHGLVDATRADLDSVTVDSFDNLAKLYRVLSQYEINETIIPDKETACISFTLDSLHTEDRSSCYMKLQNCSLNGKSAAFTFDTGAGVNVISDSLAKEYKIHRFDIPVYAEGMSEQQGWLGIAEEVKIGNISVRNVPFYVITIGSGNEEIDRYARHLNLLLGVQIMQVLGEFTIDFDSNEITVAHTSATYPDIVPNMCYSNSLQLLGNFNDGDILAIIDTGDAEYCSLNKRYYVRHEKEIKKKGIPDTQLTLGGGGVHESEGYNLICFPLTLDEHTVVLPEVYVSEQRNKEGDGLVGIDALSLFRRLHFNLNDMTLTVD